MSSHSKKILKKTRGKSLRKFATYPELLSASLSNPRFRLSITLVILILAGYAGNYFNLSLFFGVDFLFGSIAVLMVVCLYGSGWGTIAALIAGLHTLVLWKHPYAAVILTIEGLFIGRGLRLKRQNLLLLDGFYWVFIGMPLVWLFYFHVLSVPAQTVLLIALKQAVNGIFNALVASLLLAHLPLGKWVTRLKAAKPLSFYQTLFNLLVACVFFPALMLIVLHSRSALLNIETAIPANLQHASAHLVIELRSWHQQNLNALTQLAEVAARSGMAPSLALQQSTELIQRTYPNFYQVWVVDETGKAIASYPKTNTSIADNTDLKAFSQTKQTVISDVLVTGNEEVLTRIIQAIPIVHNQRWLGSVVGELDLSFVDKFLNSLVYPQHLEITLVDRQNRVISSTRSDLATLKTFDHTQNGEIRLLTAGVYQWLPVTKNMPMMSRWKNSFYVQKTPVGNNLPLSVIVEAPNQPHFSYLQNLYIGSLASVLLIVVLALILANLISSWLTRPIWNLAEVTTDLPEKLIEQKAIAWPSSWITEMNALVNNFKLMASTLDQKFQEIKSAKESLEQRVQERTQKLLTANRELEAEVAERKRVAEALRQSEALLRAQAQQLEKALHELQRTQAQLVQTEKMSSLGQLVAGVAHEINNPVNFIYGNLIYARDYTLELLRLVELYQQHYPNSTPAIQVEIEAIDLEFIREDLPKLMNSMQVGTERIQEIVQSLRNFSRVDEADMKVVDIHQGIDSTLMILQNRLKASSLSSLGNGRKYSEIEVIKEYGQLPLIECYPGQLNQVFMNILTNAIDALDESKVSERRDVACNACTTGCERKTDNRQKTDKKPMIRIRTEIVEGNRVAIRIADNGQGMGQDALSKLFDPFFTTKPVGKGTGLGLSISYQIIVEKHGGQLYCISEPGQGTQFIIKIPMGQSSRLQP